MVPATMGQPHTRKPVHAMGQKLTRRELVPVLALAALVLVSYFPSLQAGFVWDDATTFIEAPPVRTWAGLWQIWFAPSHITGEGHYWPITYTTFWLEHKLWGFAPMGYHAVNLALHFANTVLLLSLLRRLAVPGAWFAAAVFAVHPVHVEAVVWVIARKDLLATLFSLSACRVWIRSMAPTPGKPGRTPIGAWLLTLLLYVAGMLSKTVAVTLPAVLLLWHWWKQERVTARDGLRLLPFFAVGLAVAAANTAYYASNDDIDFGYSLIERMLLAAQAIGFYGAKLVWPADLVVVYPHWEVSTTNGLAWLCAAGTAVVVAGLWLLRRRIGKGPLVAVLFFVVTLLPVLGFIDYSYMEFSFAADRYQYLASAAPIALLVAAAALGVARLPKHLRRFVSAPAAALLALLGTLTWQQASLWRNQATLFSHITEHNPQARAGWYHLALGLLEEERYEEALDASRRAIVAQPVMKGTYAAAGFALLKLDRLEEAEHILREGLQRQPGEKYTLLNLAEVLKRNKQYEEALVHYDSVILKNPNHIRAYVGMGFSLYALGRYEEAHQRLTQGLSRGAKGTAASPIHELLGETLIKLGRYQEANYHLGYASQLTPERLPTIATQVNLQLAQGRFQEALDSLDKLALLEPDNPSIHFGIARALYGLERYDEARTRLEQALTLEPSGSLAADIHALLGQTLQALDTAPGEVESHYERALQANPRHEEALLQLTNLRLAQGRFAEALELLRTLEDIRPDDALIHGGIGIALARLGRRTEALAALDRALSLDLSEQRKETLRAERERIRAGDGVKGK